MKYQLLFGLLLTSLSCSVTAQTSTPAQVLDLRCWKVTLPVSLTNGSRPTEFNEQQIAAGAIDVNYFYVNQQGDGVVLRAPVQGVRTSNRTKFVRSELREMLRCGNKKYHTRGIGPNNWVFSTNQSVRALTHSGGIDGVLSATLSVDHVTTSGKLWQQGRVVIGQIHATDDEPVRIYYRKLPQHKTGSIWLVHETTAGNNTIIPVLGPLPPTSRAQKPGDYPAQYNEGIALGEKFTYQIQVTGHLLTVTLQRTGRAPIVRSVDMRHSGYDKGDQWMYFKAGVYNQNNTGRANDYVQATFYQLSASHQPPAAQQ